LADAAASHPVTHTYNSKETRTVRRIIASEGITLDGYFADPRGEIAWQALDDDFNAYSLEFLDSVDSLLFGHVTYELMRAWWPTPAGEAYGSELAQRMNSATKLVVSSQKVDLSWNNSHRLDGDLATAVSQLKSEQGGDIAILGSGTLVAQLTDHGLIDEYRVTLNPLILAGGTPLFRDVQERRKLKLAGTREFASGVVLLRYTLDPSA
jgi:dihydrofolate reductase